MGDDIPKKAVFSTVVCEARGFYCTAILLACAMLVAAHGCVGVAAKPLGLGCLLLLATCWFLSLTSILLVLNIRRMNFESGRLALDGEYTRACEKDNVTRQACALIVLLLYFAAIDVMVFGLVVVSQLGR